MKTLRRYSLLTVCVLGAAGLLVAFARPLGAQGGAEGTRGWTVWQNGTRIDYPAEDRWEGTPNPNGLTLRNGSTGVEHHYYGSFRAENRTRDAR